MAKKKTKTKSETTKTYEVDELRYIFDRWNH